MDSLCNHKEAATKWADGETQSVPVTPCDLMPFMIPNLITTSWTATTYISMMAHTHPLRRIRFKTKSSHLPKRSRHPFAWLYGRGLPGTHSLPYKTPILMSFGIALFSPTTTPSTTTSHIKISASLSRSRLPQRGQASCIPANLLPLLYFQCLTTTFADPLVFRKLEQSPNDIIEKTIAKINRQFGKAYPWALGAGRDLPNAYVLPKRKKQFKAGRPIVSFFTAPFRPMLNCTSKLIYNLLPEAFPHNLARGDVFDLIKLVKDTDFDSLPTPRIHNQDLAGFFTSIDTDRFVASWRLTLQFLSTLMNIDPDEIISVKATPGNTTGDVVKAAHAVHSM